MITIEQADNLTWEGFFETVDWEKAHQAYLAHPNRAESKKLQLLENTIPEYDVMYDKVLGDVWVLVVVSVDEVQPSDGDWERALQYETTQQYIEWFKEGKQPPPIKVVRHVDGRLISCNRRRWLAAREAGVERLLAWYIHTNSNGRPKFERKICSRNGNNEEIVCNRYKQGLSCVGCEYFEN